MVTELPAVLRARARLRAGQVRVLEAWALPAALGTNAQVYVTLRGGDQDDVLRGAYTPWARQSELQTTIADDKGTDDKGAAQLQPLVPLAIKAEQLVAFAPGQQHVQLTGLTRSIAAGQMFPLTLSFEKAGAVRVMVAVRAAAGAASSASSRLRRSHYAGTSGTMNAISAQQTDVPQPEIAQPSAPQPPDVPMVTSPSSSND